MTMFMFEVDNIVLRQISGRCNKRYKMSCHRTAC